jgi:hypothetical protein
MVSVVGGGRPLVTDEPLAWSVSAMVSVVGGGRPLVTDEPLAWSVVRWCRWSVVVGRSSLTSRWRGRCLRWCRWSVVFRP